MTLLAVLIALVLEMQLTDPGRYRPTERLEDAMRRLRGLFQGSDFLMGWPGVLLTLAAVPLAVSFHAILANIFLAGTINRLSMMHLK